MITRNLNTTRFMQSRLIASMNVAALATTLLFGSVMLPDTAEARPSREGANVRLQHTGRGRMNEVWIDLTETGKSLEARYAKELETLQANIRELVPTITSEQHEVFINDLSAMASADHSFIQSNRRLSNFVDYEQAVENFKRAESAIEDAEKALAVRHALMDYARAMPDDHVDKEFWLEWAERQIANRKRDLERAPERLEDARKAMEKASQQKGELAAEK